MSFIPNKSANVSRCFRGLMATIKRCQTDKTSSAFMTNAKFSSCPRYSNFQRSFVNANRQSQFAMAQLRRFPIQVASRTVHTEGDKEIKDFLEKEIEMEEKGAKEKSGFPKVKDFDVSVDGANVTFTRSEKGETIKIKVNINHSVLPDAPAEEMSENIKEEELPHFVSKPSFEVEINKGGEQTLALRCSFPQHDDDYENEPDGKPTDKEEETYMDLYEIEDVTIHEGEWNDKVYTLGAETMDGTLYDMLMDMLDERGITEEFVDSLVKYSTALEQEKYLSFLKDLKTFVEK